MRSKTLPGLILPSHTSLISSGRKRRTGAGPPWRCTFLDDLQQSLDKFAVPQAEQAEIKAIVASTRADIVV